MPIENSSKNLHLPLDAYRYLTYLCTREMKEKEDTPQEDSPPALPCREGAVTIKKSSHPQVIPLPPYKGGRGESLRWENPLAEPTAAERYASQKLRPPTDKMQSAIHLYAGTSKPQPLWILTTINLRLRAPCYESSPHGGS